MPRKPKQQSLREIIYDLAVPISLVVQESGIRSRPSFYRILDGRAMPTSRTELRLSQGLSAVAGRPISREAVWNACAESCRRAGNVGAVERARAGRGG